MKRFIIQAFAVVGVLTLLAGCSSEPTFDKTEPEAPFVEGEVLVKFSPEVAEALSQGVASRIGAVTHGTGEGVFFTGFGINAERGNPRSGRACGSANVGSGRRRNGQ